MTQPAVIEAWHRLVQSRDAASLSGLLAEDVVFHSPVVHTPQRGRQLTELYLGAALKVFFNDSFRYVRELVDGNNAVLEFVVEMDGISVNGVDMISWNEQGKIVDFKVMLRPLKAINLIHEKMGRMLESRQ